MAKVFVSYSRNDIDFAKKLTTELKENGLDYWIDWTSINPTVDWWKDIEKGIEEADMFLFLISKDSAKSEICNREIDTAVKNAKRIIPLVVKEIKSDEAPKQLSHLNWIFFRDSDDFKEALKKLINAIQTDYEWAAKHRRLQVKALDWERNGKDHGYLLRGRDLQDAELDLATNTSKNPHPTDLQREYVFASRKSADRQRRFITGISIAGVVAMALLAAFGFFQAIVAQTAEKTARAEQLAAIANSEKDQNFEQSLLFGTQALKMIENDQTRSAMLALLQVPAGAIKTFKTEHTAEVTDVVISSNGRFLVSGGLDSKIILWDISSSDNPRVLGTIQDMPVWKLAVSPDDKIVAAAGFDNNIINLYDISNLNTPRKISQIKAHHGRIFSVTFSPNNKLLASLSWDGYVILWDISNPQAVKELGRISNPDYLLLDLAFSPDSRMLATTSDDKDILLWDISQPSQPQKISTLSGHESGIRCIIFNKNGTLLISGSYDGTLILWDMSDSRQPQELSRLDGKNGSILAASLTPDEKILAAGDTSGDITLWDISDRKNAHKMRRLHGHSRVVTGLAISQDGNTLFSSNADHLLGIWRINDANNLASIRTIRNPSDYSFTKLAISRNQKILAVGGYQEVQLWNLSDPTNPHFVQALPGLESWVESLAFSHQNNLLAAAGEGGIFIWKLLDSGEVQKVTEIKSFSQYVDDVVFSPNDNILISVNNTSEENVILWDMSDPSHPKVMDKPQYHKNGVLSAAFSPDNETFATSGSAGWDIALWKKANETPAEKLSVLTGHTNWVNTIAFSPDGNLLVSGDGSGNIILWDVSNKKAPQKISDLIGHSDGISNFIFSEDGKTLASASYDGKVILWDVSTPAIPEKMGILNGHSDAVQGVAFLSGGKILISSSWDYTMVLWDLDPQSWLKKSCQIVGRNFTYNEWMQYFPKQKYAKTCE